MKSGMLETSDRLRSLTPLMLWIQVDDASFTATSMITWCAQNLMRNCLGKSKASPSTWLTSAEDPVVMPKEYGQNWWKYNLMYLSVDTAISYWSNETRAGAGCTSILEHAVCMVSIKKEPLSLLKSEMESWTTCALWNWAIETNKSEFDDFFTIIALSWQGSIPGMHEHRDSFYYFSLKTLELWTKALVLEKDSP